MFQIIEHIIINKMNMNSTTNELIRDELKNIVYMQIYRLYDDKEAEQVELNNSYSHKIEKKAECYKENEKQYFFIYDNNMSHYSYTTKSDLYISSLLDFALPR